MGRTPNWFEYRPSRIDRLLEPVFRWLDRLLPFRRLRPLARISSLKVKFTVVLAVAISVTAAAVSAGRAFGVRPLWTVAAALVLSVALVQILARGITAPLREMTAATQAMAAGDYSQRVEVESSDEVGQLAEAFNTMAASLADLERQRDDLIANVGHELRTPIAVLHGNLENLLDDIVDDERHTLEVMLKQTDRLGRLVGELLDLSRLEGGVASFDAVEIDLVEVARTAVAEAALRTPPPQIDLVAPPALTVEGDARRLHSVVGNLLDNAIRHGGGAGPITVTVSTAESDATLVVADRGPGVPPEELDRIFDRYFRSDQRRTSDGLGLGLAIARRVAELHGGSLSAMNAEPSGLVVTLSIPRPAAHSE